MYKNKLGQVCFTNDKAYLDSKDLTKWTISIRFWKIKLNEIVINPKYDGCQRGLASIVHRLFDKKTGLGASVNEHHLALELYKPVIKKFKRRKVYARFKDTIWAADLAEMGSLFSKNGGVKFLLCVMDVFTKYAWVKLLKDRKTKTVLHVFTEIVRQSKWKPNKFSVDQGREFHNNLMAKWLDDNGVLMYSTHNEGRSVAKGFIRKSIKNDCLL